MIVDPKLCPYKLSLGLLEVRLSGHWSVVLNEVGFDIGAIGREKRTLSCL